MLLAMLQLCVSVNEAAHQPVQITAASDSRSLGCLSPVHGGWSVDGLAGMTEGWCLCHRFNLMNNWARFKEKLTVWVIRFSTEARMKYWGLTNISPPDARRVVGLLQACILPCPLWAPSADLVSSLHA